MTEKENRKLKFIINVLFIGTILGLIYFFFKFAFVWLLPFLIAFTVSFLIDPLVNFLTRKLKWNHNVISVIIVTFVLLILGLITLILSRRLIGEIKNVFSNLNDYITYAVNFIKKIPTKYGHIFSSVSEERLDSIIVFFKNYDYSSLLSGSFGNNALKFATSLISSLPSMLIYTLITIIATYFTALSFPQIKAFILRQCSDKVKAVLYDAKHFLFDTLKKYLTSYFLLMMITFAELSIAFLIYQIKPAITLAFLIAIVDILPIFGVGTVLIPWSIIELVLGNPWKALFLICTYLVITVVRQTLEPKIIGDTVGMLPIVTLFSIFIGLQLFGVIGMFLVPITMVVLNKLQKNGRIKIWK